MRRPRPGAAVPPGPAPAAAHRGTASATANPGPASAAAHPGAASAAAPARPIVSGFLAALAVLASGCSSGSGPHAGPGGGSTPSISQLAPPRATCGTTRTAANVPVIIEVETGSAPCSLAMRIQRDYTDLVRAGQVRGNGGGAPVRVSGWTCQGEDTPTIVATGEASNCRQGQTEIVAVLNLQAQPSGSGSAG